MFDAPIAFAFTAGLIAIVNPCGFAMLPAYLSYFIGVESRADGDEPNPSAAIARALATGGVVSLGFLTVFGLVGILFTAGMTSIQDRAPGIGLAIGAAMVALGIAMMRGFRLMVAMPRLDRGTRGGRGLRSLFLFGCSYAVASLSCAFPTFIVVLGSVDDLDSGIASFVAYAAGMAVVLTALTVSLAMARQSLLHTLRKAMKHVDRAAAVLLVIAGLYMMYYWSIEIADTAHNSAWRGPAQWVENFSDSIRNLVRDLGGTRVGLVLFAIVASAVGLILVKPPRATGTGTKHTSTSTDR
ncbi:MAG: cytochrome c biogenesis protein CcdA [Actinomycetia bacterium]|nr:cytochrome c biogenesis protein CcdA [Actinomycetes bacterium]MCP4962825.1 cytochrome c biogenesis protein CcdA [Actinomycetes bacterium]